MNASTSKQLHLRARVLTDEHILASFANESEWLSRRQIADRVWRRVTPSFIYRLERLVKAGSLTRGVEPLSNGQKMFWYRVEVKR